MEETTDTTKRNFDRSDLIAVLALFLSIGAFVVSLYEARMMKLQQEIMFEEQQMMSAQQQAAVWPYLTPQISYQFTDQSTTITYQFINKGVGPAKIQSATIAFKDTARQDYSGLLNKVLHSLPQGALTTLDSTSTTDFQLNMRMPSGVLSPGEQVKWIEVSLPRFEGDRDFWLTNTFQYELGYCSIYEDCWMLRSGEKEPVQL